MADAREIEVRGEMIRLGQLLKVAGLVDAGGEVKGYLASHTVLVNGEPDDRRGRQLHPGDEVTIGAQTLRLTGR